MSKELSKMIQLYSVDTSNFYNEDEKKIYERQKVLYKRRSKVQAIQKKASKSGDNDRINRCKGIHKEIQNELKSQKDELYKLFEDNNSVRHLDPNDLRSNKLVGMFETALTRQLGIEENATTEDMMIVQVYYFDIMYDLLEDGFYYNGEKYIYFSSSAGQIRTKKLVFIKEKLWHKHKDAITCGLSSEEINNKGGANVNKYLAYIALTNSASERYDDFDIDKCIVVDDLETNVRSKVDHINRDTYEITRDERDLPIEHTDGAGMILPQKSEKSFMIRAPFIKGLLVPFPFNKFISENKSSSKVEDIYGDTWDVEKDDIQIIFFKSQFKMWKFYDSWNDYKDRFKKHGCKASKLNEEGDFPDAKLSYQVVQTLSDITDDELKAISQPTIDEINKVSTDEDVQLKILGADNTSKKSNYFQKSVNRYPELLNDDYTIKSIKDKKKSMVRNAKHAKLNVNGKYTFLCPDFYAVCENLFLGIKEPNGLLNNGEVYCDLFNNKKLDCLRSPHLYREHAVRKNIKDSVKDDWFVTHGIYTSVKDPISRILQFDNDGDQGLIVEDEMFVEIAERNMKDIYPLYYKMAVADRDYINPKNIYESLIMAFKTSIGEYSNAITKVFNTTEEPNLKVVAQLCMENNFAIDHAKTLFMPERPKDVDKEIKKHVKGKLPHFFRYAKNKTKQQVLSEHRGIIDRLDYIIPNKRMFMNPDDSSFDYKTLMREPYNDFKEGLFDVYVELSKNKRKYMNKHFKNKKGKAREFAFDKMARDKLLSYGYDRYEVVNILIKGLYRDKKYHNKTILWDSFGKEVFKNIELNTKGTKRCQECKKRFTKTGRNDIYCNLCKEEVNRRKTKENMKSKRKMFDS